jgi:hypothetical protein
VASAFAKRANLTVYEARQDGGDGLPGIQASAAASHVILFLAIGGVRGRVSLVVMAAGRGQLGAGDVVCAVDNFLRRRVNLRERSFLSPSAGHKAAIARGGHRGWHGRT